MSDTKQMLQRARDRFLPPEDVMGSLIRRRERKRRNQRIGAGALAIILALVSFVALTRAFRPAERPADEPTPKPQGIFSEVGGWIAYGDRDGIWAVDPSRPGDPGSQIQLSPDRGTPLAWSSDGSKLLILRIRNVPHQAFPAGNLFVLNADGTETRLTEGDAWIMGGSLSPDGSKVVYATDGYPPAFGSKPAPGIFVVDAAGGSPQVLLTGDGVTPTFSPDGSKIAYFTWDRQRFRLQVMNADGSGSRALSHDASFEDMGGNPVLVWSPDGTRLAIDYGLDIYTVRADGSDLTLVIRNGGGPTWSPDGSRIAYQSCEAWWADCSLQIADADGTHAVVFGYGGWGPWNPLVQPEAEVAEASVASEGMTLTSTLLLVVALLALVAGAVLIRRRMAARSRP